MSNLILSNQDICFGGYNIQKTLNQMALDLAADALDSTTFGTADRIFTPGLQTLGFSAAGFYQRALVDGALMDALGLNNTIIQVCPSDGTAGSPAAFFEAVETQYNISGQVGDMLAYNIAANNNYPSGLVRGTLMLNSTAVNANTNTTGRQLGALTAKQKLYCAANVYAVAGTSTPTLTLTIQSDDNSGFSSPTTRATLTGFTAIGAQWVEVPGAITDDWWRIGISVSGSSPVFSAMVSLGIK